MALPESWHIRSRSRACSSTERPFDDGETIMTALFPDPESSGYLRKDFCLDAWKARTTEDEKPLSFWKTKYVAPVAGEKPDAFKKESPEDLLRRLVEEEEDHTENVRYILAVMLERQKVLRETDTQRTPSGILRVYEHRKMGDVFIVRDPDIPLTQVEKVQEEVILLLETGGRIPDPEEIAEAAAAAEEAKPAEEPTASDEVPAETEGAEGEQTEVAPEEEALEGEEEPAEEDEETPDPEDFVEAESEEEEGEDFLDEEDEEAESAEEEEEPRSPGA